MSPHDSIATSVENNETEHKSPSPLVALPPGTNKNFSTDTLEFEPAPEGGFRAWTVAAGGGCLFFSCLGFANAFGVFQEYYRTHQLHDHSPDDIAWIGSIGVFIQFAVGAVGGPLFDRVGEWMIRPAAIAYVFAMMMLSLSHTYWQIMLTHGVLMGVCMGLLQFPAFAAVSQYFEEKRAAALGVVVSGSSLGGIVIPIALSKMLNGSSLSFGWSVRIVGFVVTPLMLFACVAVRARLPPRQSTFFIWAAFRDVKFNLLIAALFCMFIGMFAPLFFIPSYAVMRGVSPTIASYLLAILNAASTFGRIIPGVLADRYGRLNVFALSGALTGVIVLCMNTAKNTAGLVAYSIAFGFTSGTIISGGSAAFSLCADDPRNIGTYMGMGLAVASFAALVGPPVDGALAKEYMGFSEVSIFSGVICLVGGLIAGLSKIATPQGLLGRV